MKLFVCIVSFFFSFTTISASTTNIDSLLNVLDKQKKEDTSRLNTLSKIARYYLNDADSLGFKYAFEGNELAQKLSDRVNHAHFLKIIGSLFEEVEKNPDTAYYFYKNSYDIHLQDSNLRGIIMSNYNLGTNYLNRREHQKAIEYFLRTWELAKDTDETEMKISSVAQLGTLYFQLSDFDNSIIYDSIGIRLCREIGDKKREANFLNTMAAVYKRKGELDVALDIFHESLQLSLEIGNTMSVAFTSNNMANVYSDYGDYVKALEYYLLTLNSCEELENVGCMAASYNNIAIVYYTQEDYPKTVEYLNKSLEAYKSVEDDEGIANTINNIAEMYMKQDSLQKSLEFYNKSFPIIQELGNRYLLHYNYAGKADVYDRLKDYNKAEELHFKGLETAKEINALYEIANAYLGISDHFILRKKYSNARYYADSALVFGEKYGVPEIIKEAAENLHASYSNINNFKKAYQYHLLYTEMNDSILSDNNTKKVTQLEMQHKHDKELKEREIEQAKKDFLKEKELNRQKSLRNMFIAAFIFVLLLAFVILRNYKEKKKANELLSKQKAEIEDKNEELSQLNSEISRQKDELEKNHKKITDSIKYAEKIQTALLPSGEILKELLPKHFVLYKPRDIVSGDFYWVRHVNNLILIAVADCTGHGVPGAMMSMLGISFLNDLSRKNEINRPNIMLSELRNQVKTSLRQTGKRGETRDGMDMAFCEINLDTKLLRYSGANNPLVLIRNNELIEYKADRQPISIYFKEKEFTNHEIQLEKGDRLYMFSDGFMDQINFSNRKKFSSSGLKNKIEEVHQKPMLEQKEILEHTINEWMGEESNQVDDILVLGIEI